MWRTCQRKRQRACDCQARAANNVMRIHHIGHLACARDLGQCCSHHDRCARFARRGLRGIRCRRLVPPAPNRAGARTSTACRGGAGSTEYRGTASGLHHRSRSHPARSRRARGRNPGRTPAQADRRGARHLDAHGTAPPELYLPKDRHTDARRSHQGLSLSLKQKPPQRCCPLCGGLSGAEGHSASLSQSVTDRPLKASLLLQIETIKGHEARDCGQKVGPSGPVWSPHDIQ